jgi:putative membrane protein
MSDFKKQHPIAGVSQVIDTVKQNFITLVILLFIGTSNSDGYFLYFLAAGLGISLFGGIFGWWFFRYRVFEDELQIHKGIFVKKKLYLSKDRIQVIDITEGLLQRLFSLVKVEIKTAGGGTETATIRAISRIEAEGLRKELRSDTSKNEDPDSLQGIENGEEAKDEITASWKLSKKDLVYAAFTSGNFGLIASILGAVSGQLSELINEETIEYFYEMLPGFNDVTIYIVLILGIIIVSWLLSFLGVIFSYYDFRLHRTKDELIITRGFIERKHVTVPFDRIQAVRFVEGVIRQPFGYGMVYVESAGFDERQQGRSIVLAPFIEKNSLPDFFHEFLPDYSEPEFDTFPPKRSRLRYIRRPNYFFLPLIPLLWYLISYGWMSLLLIPVLSMLGWLRFKDAGLGIDGDTLRMRFRTISRTTAILKRNRIQNGLLIENPFQRRKDIKSLEVTVASGSGGMNFKIVDLDNTENYSIYKWINKDEQQPEKEDVSFDPGLE